jgi:hypothetical protein
MVSDFYQMKVHRLIKKYYLSVVKLNLKEHFSFILEYGNPFHTIHGSSGYLVLGSDCKQENNHQT